MSWGLFDELVCHTWPCTYNCHSYQPGHQGPWASYSFFCCQRIDVSPFFERSYSITDILAQPEILICMIYYIFQTYSGPVTTLDLGAQVMRAWR